MGTYIVSIRPKENFNQPRLFEHMKTYQNWARINPNLWMATYPGNSRQLRSAIGAATGETCRIIVVDISGSRWATLNLDRVLTDWMIKNI